MYPTRSEKGAIVILKQGGDETPPLFEALHVDVSDLSMYFLGLCLLMICINPLIMGKTPR